MPSLRQWRYLAHTLTRTERFFLYVFIWLVVISSVFSAYNYYLESTTEIPKPGGIYTEGILGEPLYINPVLAQTNDTDRDLTEIIFSRLLTYDPEGNLTYDVAENYEIKDEGKTYEVRLRNDVKFHDGEQLNADDVIFTVKIIQNKEYKSPLRVNWQGVDVEKIDDFGIRFKLTKPYAPFIENLTFGILPKHIWERKNIQPSNFYLDEANLQPVGSGPYKFRMLTKENGNRIKSIELESNEDYFKGAPFIKRLAFRFYGSEDEMINAYKKGDIDGINFISTRVKNKENLKKINLYSLVLPRYFAVFFNQTKSKPLSDKTVRAALAYATNKQELIDKVLNGEGFPVNSPILPGSLGYTNEIKIYDFALEHANNILEADGWKDENGDGIREKVIGKDKEATPLEITITTIQSPELSEAAKILKEQWEKIGAKVNIREILNILEIEEEYIRPRNYEIILFGQVIGHDPDPFSFWHSTQKKDPGLNIAMFDNKEADTLLEEARQTSNTDQRINKYKEFQKILSEEIPAIFLYSPNYIYGVHKKVKGITTKNIVLPSQRFANIEKWYIKTERIKKLQ